MSTPNFITQSYFDLYLSDTTDWNDFDYEFIKREFDDEKEILLNHYKKYRKYGLNYLDIELKCGYYTGLQFYITPSKYLKGYDNGEFYRDIYKWIEQFSNEDTWYIDSCNKSIFKKHFESEMNFVNKKLLPRLAKVLGFEKYKCIGVFSNGEAIYEKSGQ